MSAEGWRVSAATPEDLEGVLAVDRASFMNPTTREALEAELSNTGVSFCMVVRRGEAGPIVGFCAFWRVLDELHINNVAVMPDERRSGAGTVLLEAVLEEGLRLGAHRATLEVRRSNTDARRVYDRLGFTLAGVRRAYYTNPVEDALVLWREAPLGPAVG